MRIPSGSRPRLCLLCVAMAVVFAGQVAAAAQLVEVPADVLEDKIRGGMLGQILGNLNGLPHEMKYIREPGNVERYVPSLPEGARTDDDTDIEWVYISEMQRTGTLKLAPTQIVGLWKAHVNRGIWCSNDFARQLFELGLEPPLTGREAINPWARFNISGSFLSETFALASPGMPQSAARLALNYTHVGIDGEPAQTTQFVAAMISTAFVEKDINKVVDAGLAAVDRKSVIPLIATHVRTWHREHPDDWPATRKLIRDTYTRFGDGGEMGDKNGYELNTAATVAALLYGKGDFVETLRYAFNFGWDADNNAATGGAIVGVIKGKRWMDAQGWDIKDEYRNTTRDGMPNDETITRFTDRVIAVAGLSLKANGGGRSEMDGKAVYRIPLQEPGNVEPLVDPETRLAELKAALLPTLDAALKSESAKDRARAAYLAICLGEADRLSKEEPEAWGKAIGALNGQSGLVKAIFASPKPLGPALHKRAMDAGVRKAG